MGRVAVETLLQEADQPAEQRNLRRTLLKIDGPLVERETVRQR
jgi:DNA-binding LacI/PurR family transcriptional regulator